ncbi:MAG: hypothetical protein QW478_00600 [Candidatus Micrarchaeaceae archaeon]
MKTTKSWTDILLLIMIFLFILFIIIFIFFIIIPLFQLSNKLNNSLNQLNNNFTTLDNDLKDLKSKFDSINNNMASAATDLHNLYEFISSLNTSSDIKTLKDDVNQILNYSKDINKTMITLNSKIETPTKPQVLLNNASCQRQLISESIKNS